MHHMLTHAPTPHLYQHAQHSHTLTDTHTHIQNAHACTHTLSRLHTQIIAPACSATSSRAYSAGIIIARYPRCSRRGPQSGLPAYAYVPVDVTTKLPEEKRVPLQVLCTADYFLTCTPCTSFSISVSSESGKRSPQQRKASRGRTARFPRGRRQVAGRLNSGCFGTQS